MALHFGIAHLGEGGWLPTRFVVLVDDHGAYALVEVMTMDDARHYAEFGAHARREIPFFAAPYLRQRQFKTERRFCTQNRRRFAGPFGIGALGTRLAVERGQDVLDPASREQPVDGAVPRHDGPLPRGFRECRQQRVHRNGSREPVAVSYTHLTLPTIYSV